MQGDIKENAIEWYTGSKTATVTFTQKKFINRIRRLQNAGEHVEIVAENADGSITAHISPVCNSSDDLPQQNRAFYGGV